MVLLIKKIAQIRSRIRIYRQLDQCKIGLVPTMGALHQGHLSLINKAIAENDIVVVSIFVNPLQFAPTEDLDDYPRQLELDLNLCQKLGVDIVFAPNAQEMDADHSIRSPEDKTVVIPPESMTQVLCGQYRPGHFTGVATIVTKLFQLIQPDTAYFGQKDAQQLAIIKRLVKNLNIPIKIQGCPIIREPSGLALSSRNQYLSEAEKELAAQIHKSLQKAKRVFEQGQYENEVLTKLVSQELSAYPGFKIQYVELVDPTSLQSLKSIKTSGLLAIAVHLGSTRLIDNIVLQKRQPIIAIDGPAGAGKSTVTRQVAHQLGLLYLDTGAMYRAVTWLVMESEIPLDDQVAISNLIQDVSLKLSSPEAVDLPTIVHIDEQEVTKAIRTPEVTANVSVIAAQEAVRAKLVLMQQQWGIEGGLIAEGRDIGTNVFPDAELKIFLTASVTERARRRWQDLQNQGRDDINLEQLAQDIQSRDEQDSNREIAPLKQANDAIQLVTDNLTIEQVIAKIMQLFRQIN